MSRGRRAAGGTGDKHLVDLSAASRSSTGTGLSQRAVEVRADAIAKNAKIGEGRNIGVVKLKDGRIDHFVSDGPGSHSETLALKKYGDDIEERFTERSPCSRKPDLCSAALAGGEIKVTYSFLGGEANMKATESAIRKAVTRFRRTGTRPSL